MTTGRMGRIAALFLVLMLFCAAGACAESGGNSPLLGEWAFDYEPETTVLKVSADGSARYKDRDFRWEDRGTALVLTDADGTALELRYAVTEDGVFIYPQTRYRRGEKEVEGQGGLIGIWEGAEDGSSFVFTPAGYFLEDSVFSGNFMMNAEEGTFLLHYGDAFRDTLCYYSIADEILTVEYPWKIVKTGSGTT